MRTPRKDMFVSIVTIIWLVTNLVVYLITLNGKPTVLAVG